MKSSFTAVLTTVIGGYDHRLPDNVNTLEYLIRVCKDTSLSFSIISNGTKLPEATVTQGPPLPDVIFLLNFTTRQRQYLLHSPRSICFLYTPGNEHFGIGPVEAMACGLPVIACTSGGPTESLIDYNTTVEGERGTAWLRDPDPGTWAKAMTEVLQLSAEERQQLGGRAKRRAREKFSLQEMTTGFETAIEDAFNMGPVLDISGGGVLGVFVALFAIVSWVEYNGLNSASGPIAILSILGLAFVYYR